MLAVRAAVVLLAAIALASNGVNAAHAGRAGLRLLHHQPANDPRQHVVDQISSLRRQLAAQVPAGSRIAIGEFPPDYVGWHQRIAEIATLEHILVAVNPADADYRVSFYLDPASPDGAGLRLVAEALR